MKKNLSLIVILIFFSISIQAQRGGKPTSPEDRKIKILEAHQTLKIAKDNTEKTNIYLYLSTLIRVIDVDSSIIYAKEAVKYSLQTVDTLLIVNSYTHLSSRLQRTGKDNLALEYLDECNAYITSSVPPQMKGRYYLQTAQIQYKKGNYELALEDYQKSLKELKPDDKDKLLVAMIYSQIGNIHMRNRNFLTSIEYFNQAIPIYEEAERWSRVSSCWRSIWHSYEKLGEEDLSQEALKKVEEYSKKKKVTTSQ